MSRAAKKRLFRASTLTATALAGICIFGTMTPAQASGWDVDQGHTPAGGGLYWALTYEANLRGMEFGMGACSPGKYEYALGNNTYLCDGWYDAESGYEQQVANDAHSLASIGCYGATTWVYANSVGNYNYVDNDWYGTLNSALANNEQSVGIGNEC